MKSASRPSKLKRKSDPLGLLFLLLLLVLVLLVIQASLSHPHTPAETSFDLFETDETGSHTTAETAQETEEPTALTSEPIRQATLVAVGDVILHQAVIDGALIQDGSPPVYDFSPAFRYIRPIIESADLAFANFEGTLAGQPYSGYPFFCAPDAIADALYASGFRVALTANNHALDRGLSGLIRTASVFEEKGFYVIGTKAETNGRSDQVVDINGILVGLMAFTFETEGTETQRSLNGIPMPAGAKELIDSFNPYHSDLYQHDLGVLLDRAEELRAEGAELICLSLHWGNEYQTHSCNWQRQMAQELANAGIELIIGHHPHVLQEIEVLTAKDGSGQTLVFYSISNILHNMDYNTHNTKGYAQDAVIARITLEGPRGDVRITGADYIPTYVTRVPKGEKKQHFIVPVSQALDDPDVFMSNPQELADSLARTNSILASSTGTKEIPIRECKR